MYSNHYIKEINKFKVLTKNEERKLFELIKNGDENAKNELIKHNLRLVIFIARKMIGRGVAIEDLIQEGNIGLMKAVDKINIKDHDVRFSTYASWWIWQAMSRAIDSQPRLIHIPYNIISTAKKIIRTKIKLEKERNCKPTINDIVDECEVSMDEAINCMSAFNMDIVYFSDIMHDSEYSDMIDIKFESCIKSDYVDDYDKKDLLFKILKTIDENKDIKEKYKNIFKDRIGLNEYNRIYTLKEIGKRNGKISKERARQIILEVKNIIKEQIKNLI